MKELLQRIKKIPEVAQLMEELGQGRVTRQVVLDRYAKFCV